MKAVLLAGGLGTRISEETTVRPKPMVEIGGLPILWHIMKLYAAHGVNDFIICCGYKGWVIKEYFATYFLRQSDVTIDLRTNQMSFHRRDCEPWTVTLVDTGANTMTGGRLKRVRAYIGDEPFCFTYGDGVADIDIRRLIEFHRGHGALATMTTVQPAGRFGMVHLEANSEQVSGFKEKPRGDGAWVNGGFFVLQPDVIDYVEGDATVWEDGPLQRLAHEGQLMAYRHDGFWHPMDTLRDRDVLEKLWARGEAPWKRW
jgi:glucose-1-phosphate cytidylyltransferase